PPSACTPSTVVFMTRRPPCSTLFPYTTLFRSWEALQLAGITEAADLPAASLSHGGKRKLEVALAVVGRPKVLLLDEPTAGMSAEDRKSTRLNSSHVKISYAVFCLKKKKTITRR